MLGQQRWGGYAVPPDKLAGAAPAASAREADPASQCGACRYYGSIVDLYVVLYGTDMTVTNYTDARANLAALMDRATEDREDVRITRRGKPDVVLIAADELERLREEVYLFRSPANAARLAEALEDSAAGRNMEPLTLEEVRRELLGG
jgi:antitoxin YefM